MMNKTDVIPLWVAIAFSAVSTRKGALILIGINALFSLYCIPWLLFVSFQSAFLTEWLIDDWSWIAVMFPLLVWYIACLRWMDNHHGWESPAG